MYPNTNYKKIASTLVLSYLKMQKKNVIDKNVKLAIRSIIWGIKNMVIPITIHQGKEYIENKYSEIYWNNVLLELSIITTQDIKNAKQVSDQIYLP